MDDLIPVSNDIDMLNSEKEALCQRFKMDDRGEAHYSTWDVDQERQKSKDSVMGGRYHQKYNACGMNRHKVK